MSVTVARKKAEELLLSQLDLIERVTRSICRRHRIPEQEIEQFDSWVKLKLVDNDYAVLRRYRSESKFSTYITTVIDNLLKDYCNQKWGKWRPSSTAARFCAAASLLEKLLYWDQIPLTEAVRITRSSQPWSESEDDLCKLAAHLPARLRRRFVSDQGLERLAAADRSEERIEAQERTPLLGRIKEALRTALHRLEPEDVTILKMHYFEGATIAEIAAALGLNQRALYSRRDRCLKSLRQTLEARGLTHGDVAQIIGWESPKTGLALEGLGEV